MTALDENVTNGSLTLGQRLAEGPLPLHEALRHAMMLAEALRQLHDSGRTCGALLPSNITVSSSGLELTLTPNQAAPITPYTAPEILQGNSPDVRSDIFAFGAIVYEMIAGARAFAGDDSDALAASLTHSVPAPSGSPAVDHLVANCIAKDPAVRFQCMQKVAMEFKLLSFKAPRVETETRGQRVTAALRAETQQLEARMAALVQTHEKAILEVQQTSSDAIRELRAQLSKVESELASTQARSAPIEALCQRAVANAEAMQRTIDELDERVTVARDGVAVLSQGATAQREYVGTRMHEFEHALKSQGTSIASLAVGQKQTDDVVEGIVGAMELLHSMVADRVEEFA